MIFYEFVVKALSLLCVIIVIKQDELLNPVDILMYFDKRFFLEEMFKYGCRKDEMW